MKFLSVIALLLPMWCWAQNDAIKHSYLPAKRIVWQQGVDNARVLLKPGIHQAELYGNNSCVLKSRDGKADAIILDFGKEIHGGLEIVTTGFSGKTPIKVRLRFGESVSETLSDVGVDGATNEHSLRDFEQLLPWMGRVEVGNTGFRFVRIDLLDKNRELKLQEVSAISKMRDIPYLGSFECDDEQLNEIWKTGAHTVHLNMQDYLWDGIKRDRLVWVGDMHPEVMTINAVFGYNEVVPKSLDYIREATPVSKWMNNISSYSMWWLLIQRDWFMAHGDKAYLKKQKEYTKALLKKLMSKVDENGVERLDGTRFLDWPTSRDQQTIKLGYQSLLILTLEAGAEIMEVLGDKSMAKECLQKVELMKNSHLMIDAKSKQAAALLELASIIDANKAEEIILKDGPKRFSTFYGYYMLEALAKTGAYKEALDIIKQYWGGMLKLGATSFWEDFDINWMKNAGKIDEMPAQNLVDVHRKYGAYCYKNLRHSLCHGWASGPTAWLSAHVLGVKVIEAGCRKVEIEPHLGDLKWAKGTFPTPYGNIEIAHKKNSNGKIETQVTAPKEVKVTVKNALPTSIKKKKKAN
ncbi:alpha-L-rhamnosidase [Prolixibacteraceae bacterium JC049]|nr:alpha-L-rhamnosidase [Prolixibacteraceae bacterium JC049]